MWPLYSLNLADNKHNFDPISSSTTIPQGKHRFSSDHRSVKFYFCDIKSFEITIIRNRKRKGNAKWPANQEHQRPQQTSPHNVERPYFRTKGTGNRPWYLRLTQGNRHERKTRHRRGHHETPKKTHPDRAKEEEETYRRVARPWGDRNTAGKERQEGRHQNES